MDAPIFSVCSKHPAVTALLGSGVDCRLYSYGEAPDDVQRPYAVWRHINGMPGNLLSGRPKVDDFTLQVDVYAGTGATARLVAEALRTAIERRANIVRWGGADRDPDTRDYHRSFDVDWIVHR